MVLYRHAHAGSRERWTGDDRLRPLSDKGRRQAEWMAERLAGLPIRRLVSSPYDRCLQTLEPLARRLDLPIAQTEDLAEGAQEGQIVSLLEKAVAERSALCTHGDVMAIALEWLVDQAAAFAGDPGEAAKGSAWIVERASGGLEARYVPVPKVGG